MPHEQMPLDQPLPEYNVGKSALRWLIVFGAVNLFSRLIYAVVVPFFISFLAIDHENIRNVYDVLNICTNLLNAGVAIAIIVKIPHPWSRVIFAGLVLSNFYGILRAVWELAL